LTGERGFALLEVVVATVLLAVAGLAVTASIAEAMRAADRARDADEEIRRADAFFHRVALWPREDLDRRLGDRPQGPWRLRIDRPDPHIYRVVLTDSTAARREILRTALFRRDTADAE